MQEYFIEDISVKSPKKNNNKRMPRKRPPFSERPKNKVCFVCSKAFISTALLQRHLLVHSGERPFRCDVCDKSFKREGYLKIHKLTHTGERPHQCPYCDRRFTVKEALTRHVMLHTGERPYVCKKCNQGFVQSSQLKNHMDTHKKRSHHCGVCKRSFVRYTDLWRHMQIHYAERKHACEVCDKKFLTARALRRHMKVHTEEKKYICGVCDKRHRTNHSLQLHLRTHLQNLPCKCETCQNEFKTKHNFKDPESHYKHVCDLCFKKFRNKSALESHMLWHLGLRAHKCKECGKCYNKARELKVHAKKHSGKVHECDQCDKSFTSEHALQNHSNTHSQEVLPHCKLCRTAFNTNSKDKSDLLRDHVPNCEMRNRAVKQLSEFDSLATGVGKAIVCAACNKSVPFIYKENMRRHIISHTGGKPHKCEECSLGFADKGPLQRHLVTAHGMKVKERDKNGPTLPFRDLSELKEHIRTHTKEQQLSCEVCNKAFKKRKEMYDKYLLTQGRPPSPALSNSSLGDLQDNYEPGGNLSDQESDYQPLLVTQDVETAYSGPTIVQILNLESNQVEYSESHAYQITNSSHVAFSESNTVNEIENLELVASQVAANSDPNSLTKIASLETMANQVAADSQPVSVKKKFPCNLCERSFGRRVNLVAHSKVHSRPNGNVCDICGKRFSRRVAMRLHRLTHTKEYPHKCDMCDKKFLTKYQLHRHMMTHTGLKPHACQFCNKSFSVIRALNTHLRYAHIEKLPGPKTVYSCDQCGKVFGRRSFFRDHMLRHTSECPYKCEFCDKSLWSKYSLKNHLLEHQGKAPSLYNCKFCDTKFSQRDSLFLHIRECHSQDKPFSCDLCPKKYKDKSALNRHVKLSHKSSTCPLCNEEFSRPFYLRKHIAFRHPNEAQNAMESFTDHSNKTNLAKNNPPKAAKTLSKDSSSKISTKKFLLMLQPPGTKPVLCRPRKNRPKINSPKKKPFSSKKIPRREMPGRTPLRSIVPPRTNSLPQRPRNVLSEKLKLGDSKPAERMTLKPLYSIPQRASSVSIQPANQLKTLKPLNSIPQIVSSVSIQPASQLKTLKTPNSIPQRASSVSIQPANQLWTQQSSESPGSTASPTKPLYGTSPSQPSISGAKTITSQKPFGISSVKPWQGITRIRVLK